MRGKPLNRRIRRRIFLGASLTFGVAQIVSSFVDLRAQAGSPMNADIGHRPPEEPIARFYRGKTLSLIIGTSSGNDYDFRARLLARYLGRYIPGHPMIVPQNMPSAGGVKAANYLASIAPRDGTVLHMIMSNIMMSEAIGVEGVQFDTRKFFWIGNTISTPVVTVAWYTSGITTLEQVKTKQLIVGAPAGTAGVVYCTAMNRLLGTKFKIVTGYPGGDEVNLAMERGEVQGRASNSWASWKSTQSEWVRDKKIIVLVQIELSAHPICSMCRCCSSSRTTPWTDRC